MAGRLTLRAIGNVSRFQFSRSIATSARVLLQDPHGGEGTKYRERELAAEAAYIRKHEERLREMKKKDLTDKQKDKDEILRLMGQTDRAHVKELLRDLADHL